MATALCDVGDSATGGGYTKTPDVEVNYNGPPVTTITDGWEAIGTGTGGALNYNGPPVTTITDGWEAIGTGTGGALGAIVLCYDNPPLRP